jgi:hypothetical protein
MRSYALAAFAALTLAALAGVALAQNEVHAMGPGGVASSPVNPGGGYTTLPAGPYHTNMPMLPGEPRTLPAPGTDMPISPGGPSAVQRRVFGDAATMGQGVPFNAAGRAQAMPRFNQGPGAQGGAFNPLFRGAGR